MSRADEFQQATTATPEPVVVTMSIIAALNVIWGGAGIASYVQGWPWLALVFAFGPLATAAAATGVQYWVRGQVTPVSALGDLIGQDGAHDVQPVAPVTVVAGQPAVPPADGLLVLDTDALNAGAPDDEPAEADTPA